MSMKVTKEQFIGMTYDELLAENEKLWALNEHMGLKDMAVIGGLEEENERLKAENDSLRGLVEDMWPHVRHRSRMCGECELPCDTGDECLLYEPMRQRMRDLGVEVDE